MTNEEKAIFECQKELANKGKFFQSEMAQYAIQLAFEKGTEWKSGETMDTLLDFTRWMNDRGFFREDLQVDFEHQVDTFMAMREGGEE